MKPDSPASSRKSVLDRLLLGIPGVEGGDMSGLHAYFINKKMFACITDTGVGIRLSASDATNLQFSRADAVPFEPKGKPSTREWVQINHDDPADYERDTELFRASAAFVKAERSR